MMLCGMWKTHSCCPRVRDLSNHRVEYIPIVDGAVSRFDDASTLPGSQSSLEPQKSLLRGSSCLDEQSKAPGIIIQYRPNTTTKVS